MIPATAAQITPDAANARAEREEAALARKLMLVDRLRRIAEEHGLYDADRVSDEHFIGRMRRARRRAAEDPIAAIEFVDAIEALLWRPAQTGSPALARRRAEITGRSREVDRVQNRSVAPMDGGARELTHTNRHQVLARFQFRRLERGEIAAHIRAIDERWFGRHMLRRLHCGVWKEAPPPDSGRILLIVPGAFASASGILGQLQHTKAGRAFLAGVEHDYAGIYAYRHPVLHETPAVSAAVMAQLFRDRPVEIDVIAHGVGGTVTRWWIDAFRDAAAPRARAVLVGYPREERLPPRREEPSRPHRDDARVLRRQSDEEVACEGLPLALPVNFPWAPSVLTSVASGLLDRATAPQDWADQGARSAFDKATDRLLHLSLLLLTVAATVSPGGATDAQLEPVAAMMPGWLALAGAFESAEHEALSGLPARDLGRYASVSAEFAGGAPEWDFARELASVNGRYPPHPLWLERCLLPFTARQPLVGAVNDLLIQTGSETTIGGSALRSGDELRLGPEAQVHHLNYFESPLVLEFLRGRFA